MFICKPCHGRREHCRHVLASYGRCEVCKEPAACFECHDTKMAEIVATIRKNGSLDLDVYDLTFDPYHFGLRIARRDDARGLHGCVTLAIDPSGKLRTR